MVGRHRSNRFALTGTPGTGKSAVAALLPKRYTVSEVGDLALRWGTGHRIRGGVEVDLARLRRRIGAQPATDRPWVLVGHLAHLLPVQGAILLRCHPIELERRLSRARRGRPEDRRENAVAEATDVVLVEAIARCTTLWEIDTTDRSPSSVARAVARRLRTGGPSRYGTVDWLMDPKVTAHLLDARP